VKFPLRSGGQRVWGRRRSRAVITHRKETWHA